MGLRSISEDPEEEVGWDVMLASLAALTTFLGEFEQHGWTFVTLSSSAEE